MTVRLEGSVAHLEGDWTISEAADNIDSLVHSLEQLESAGQKNLQVDCELIEETDLSGLQLLNVWFECAGQRGIRPKLINVTDGMQRAINELGFSRCFSQRSLYKRRADKQKNIISKNGSLITNTTDL